MKTFKSLYLDNSTVPEDSIIFDGLTEVGYDGFLPKTFIADLLIISKSKLFGIETPICNEYVDSMVRLFNGIEISKWVKDTLYYFKRIAQNYDLRIIESFATNNTEINLSDIKFSYNYAFDIKELNSYTKQLLNISDEHVEELERLSDDVVEVLTIANGLGSFLKTSKRIVSSNKQMTKYGDITKLKKHVLVDPLFQYKYTMKEYDVDVESVVTHKSNKIVVGYFFGNYKRQGIVNMLIKLLGSILLNNYSDDISVIIYSFLADTYVKEELNTVEEIIDYFSSPKQLKLFSINNSKALRTMVTENPGDDIIFLPNVKGACYINSDISGRNRVNMISVKESSKNMQYSTVCTKTGGTFITI